MDKTKKFLAIVIILVAGFSFLFIGKAKAGDDENVSGYAWSDNIGWISFNCNNTGACGASDYGVNIDQDGIFSGYAWSDNIGWISFNEAELSGCPTSPCKAQLNFNNNKVSGWARAMAHDDSWDGWILLGPIIVNDIDYGVRIDTSVSPNQFQNWAWSDINIGWISFNCGNTGTCETSNYGVKINPGLNSPAYVGTGTAQIAGENYCNFSPTGQISVQWKYQDNDGDSQSQYNIQVATDSSFNNKTIDCVVNQIVSPNSMGTSAARAVLSPFNVCNDGGLLGNRSLDINYRGSANPYYWRVRVKAGSGNLNWSDFENGQTSIVTPSHPYPLVDFNPVPSNPLVDEIVLFVQDGSDTENTNSFCYAGGEGPCQNKPTPPVSFFWDFGNSQTSSIKGNATTSYGAKGIYDATLRISDDVGACTTTKSINIKKPSLPKWKEVSP